MKRVSTIPPVSAASHPFAIPISRVSCPSSRTPYIAVKIPVARPLILMTAILCWKPSETRIRTPTN